MAGLSGITIILYMFWERLNVKWIGLSLKRIGVRQNTEHNINWNAWQREDYSRQIA